MSGSRRIGAVAGVATVLAGLALAPIFADSGWFPYLVVTVAAVTAAGIGLRAVHAPVWVQPAGLLAVVVCHLCVLFGPGGPAGRLPTPGTLRSLGGLAAAGFRDISELSAPVPTRPGLLLLVTAGVGVVAVVVDLLAVGLRRPALAGLPLLALYVVPVTVNETAVGWHWFLLGAGGYLWLLRTDSADRIRRWGRPFRPGSVNGGPVQGGMTGGPGLALTAAGLVVAVVLPGLLPSMSAAGLFSTGEGAGFGRGGSRNVETINPITRLKGELVQRDNLELLRVHTDDPDPFYLRLTTLDVFRRNEGWSQSTLEAGAEDRVTDGIPGDPGLWGEMPGQDITTRVEIRGLRDSQYLPVYANVHSVDVQGDWRYDNRAQTVFSVRTNTRGLDYTMRSFSVDYRPDLLERSAPLPPEDDLSRHYTAVQPDPLVQPTVDRIVAGARTPYERAVALNAYFSPRNGFRYSLRTRPGTSGDDLVDFLRNKQGYCEQYASALAYLARLAGLPARVAIGFTRGELSGDHWSVGTRDAHAWVEIYFDGLGWVPFDPTPLGGEGNAAALPYTAPVPAETTGPTAPGAGPAPDPGASRSTNPKADQLGREEDNGGPAPAPVTAGAAAGGRSPVWSPVTLGVLLLLVALSAPAVARLVWRQRRRRIAHGADAVAAAHAAWEEITGTLIDLRTPAEFADTPRSTAARIAADAGFDQAGRDALALLASAEERARYAAVALPPAGLVAATGAVRHRLLADAGRWRAVRAAAFPASVLEAGSAALTAAVGRWSGAARRVAATARRLWPRFAR